MEPKGNNPIKETILKWNKKFLVLNVCTMMTKNMSIRFEDM